MTMRKKLRLTMFFGVLLVLCVSFSARAHVTPPSEQWCVRSVQPAEEAPASVSVEITPGHGMARMFLALYGFGDRLKTVMFREVMGDESAHVFTPPSDVWTKARVFLWSGGAANPLTPSAQYIRSAAARVRGLVRERSEGAYTVDVFAYDVGEGWEEFSGRISVWDEALSLSEYFMCVAELTLTGSVLEGAPSLYECETVAFSGSDVLYKTNSEVATAGGVYALSPTAEFFNGFTRIDNPGMEFWADNARYTLIRYGDSEAYAAVVRRAPLETHHIVRAVDTNQKVIYCTDYQEIFAGETPVFKNGVAVSIAALREHDVITVQNREDVPVAIHASDARVTGAAALDEGGKSVTIGGASYPLLFEGFDAEGIEFEWFLNYRGEIFFLRENPAGFRSGVITDVGFEPGEPKRYKVLFLDGSSCYLADMLQLNGEWFPAGDVASRLPYLNIWVTFAADDEGNICVLRLPSPAAVSESMRYSAANRSFGSRFIIGEDTALFARDTDTREVRAIDLSPLLDNAHYKVTVYQTPGEDTARMIEVEISFSAAVASTDSVFLVTEKTPLPNGDVAVSGFYKGAPYSFEAKAVWAEPVKEGSVGYLAFSVLDKTTVRGFQRLIDPQTDSFGRISVNKILYAMAQNSFPGYVSLRYEAYGGETESYHTPEDATFVIYEAGTGVARAGSKEDICFDKYGLGFGDRLVVRLDNQVVREIIVIKNL